VRVKKNQFLKEYSSSDSVAVGKQIDDIFKSFRLLQNRMHGDEKNIDWWAKNKNLDELIRFVENIKNTPTKSSMKKEKGKYIVLRDDEDWFIIVPLSHEASCYYGSGTDWCTTKANRPWFSKYFFSNNITLVYCLNKKDPKIKYALSLTKELISFLIKNPEETIKDNYKFKKFGDDNNIFNVQDTSITLERFEYNTKLKVDAILKLVVSSSNVTYVKRTANKKYDITLGLSKLKFGVPVPEIENMIIATENSIAAVKYVYKVYNKPYPKLESLIAKDCLAATLYANSLTYYK
jgi:hypothetical protein